MKPILRRIKVNGKEIIQYQDHDEFSEKDIWAEVEAPFVDVRTETEKLQDRVKELIDEVERLKNSASPFGRFNGVPNPINVAPLIVTPQPCQHDFPLPWYSTGAPSCRKCGQQGDVINPYQVTCQNGGVIGGIQPIDDFGAGPNASTGFLRVED